MTGGWFSSLDILWLPVVPWAWVAALLALAAAITAAALWRRAWGMLARAAFCLLFAGLLMNPVLRQQERVPLQDKVLVVVDESGSQALAGRDLLAEEALARIEHGIQAAGMAPVVLRVPGRADGGRGESTRLFAALRDSLATLPLGQIAATVFVTDGQVHDAPSEGLAEGDALSRLGPFHAVLTGRRDEFDRKVAIVQSPQYGLIGQDVRLHVRVDESGTGPGGSGGLVALSVWQGDLLLEERDVVPGEEALFVLPLRHAGQNVFEFKAPVATGEMSALNNTAPVIVNAVRDRLRVLLVSGVPHMGERAWRNLLKSDPGIDLVHFTILRSVTAVDPTPGDEMSLIVFPVDELFAQKINDFDLIVFDNYRQHNLLPDWYFENIRRYIREGGAFLLAMGSGEVEDSLFETPLADTLPVRLRGTDVLADAFIPKLTETGARHPITADLARFRENWGAWQTQVPVELVRGRSLMTGQRELPLVVIDEIEDGRVAAIASDNLWFWAQGGAQGGPYHEFLRNLSHWLMKEPELDEGHLKVDVRGQTINVSMRTAGMPENVTMTAPDKTETPVTLADAGDGWLRAAVPVSGSGVYRFRAGKSTAFAVVGTAESVEFSDIITSEERMRPSVAATGGGILWFGTEKEINFRRLPVGTSRSRAGRDWLGLVETGSYTVKSVTSRAFFLPPVFLFVAGLGLLGMWLAESGRRRR